MQLCTKVSPNKFQSRSSCCVCYDDATHIYTIHYISCFLTTSCDFYMYLHCKHSDWSTNRPVSLTSVICKVLEKIIVIQISEHLKANSLTCPAQHGFKAGRSTVTNLLGALNVWTEALMHRHPIDVIYLDYAKAFDTVPHQSLIRQIFWVFRVPPLISSEHFLQADDRELG